jgi:hypothetical protein
LAERNAFNANADEKEVNCCDLCSLEVVHGASFLIMYFLRLNLPIGLKSRMLASDQSDPAVAATFPSQAVDQPSAGTKYTRVKAHIF